ncbi:MAG: dimethyl sulfoxide reductase anchor subunit family protein [Rhizobiaceae bacterium]
MHPAFSIIVFTTLSGLGYGLAAMLGLNLLDPSSVATKVGHLLALALIAAGLLSSTLHLGNPQRARRALSQWRSSWLSREGVLALLTFVPLVVSAWALVIDNRYLAVSGLLGTAGAIATVYCTSMIYASLKSVDAWHTPLTTACYLLFALAGGLLVVLLLAVLSFDDNTPYLGFAALAATVAAWSVKIIWRKRLKSKKQTSTPETATGLGFIGKVRLLEAPHMTENYLTREMGFKIARKHADKLFAIALIAGGLLPSVLSLIIARAEPGFGASMLALLTVAFYVLGVMVERWLFFAEARHAVTNYYRS